MCNKWKRSLVTMASVTAGVILFSPFAQAAVHTVVPGETLWSISRRYDTTVENIMTVNGLHGDLLHPGQKLTVPDIALQPVQTDSALSDSALAIQAEAADAEAQNQAEPEPAQPLSYVVQPGDSLYIIGQKYTVTVEEIMAANNLTSTLLQIGQTLTIPAATVTDTNQERSATSRGGGSREGTDIVDKAKAYLGTPYRYGASGPSSFDCSGFTAYVYAQFGRTLPHNAASQFGHGQPVAKNDLQPGDLVFFGYYGSRDIQHVGIFVGGNNFIHASSSGGVKYSSLAQDYYFKNYKGARRL
ncbi:MAG: LysM peptidoglycan-binding domain-containing protein [bacterium]|jgi:peptidoglycan endopeptidase LytE